MIHKRFCASDCGIGSRARQGGDCALGAAAVLLLLRHGSGERGQRRRFEQQAQVQLQPEFFAHSGDHLRGGDRVAAKQEEVIVGVDLFDVELLGPDFADQRFKFGCAGGRLLRFADAVDGNTA